MYINGKYLLFIFIYYHTQQNLKSLYFQLQKRVYRIFIHHWVVSQKFRSIEAFRQPVQKLLTLFYADIMLILILRANLCGQNCKNIQTHFFSLFCGDDYIGVGVQTKNLDFIIDGQVIDIL